MKKVLWGVAMAMILPMVAVAGEVVTQETADHNRAIEAAAGDAAAILMVGDANADDVAKQIEKFLAQELIDG